MADQSEYRYRPLSQTTFFGDERSARPEVPGTVARGHLEADSAFYTGRVNGQLVTALPVPLTLKLLERGQERFNVFCSPCHDRTGYGNGMIVQRGFQHPPSYHIDRLRQAPIGHFFEVPTRGFGVMPSYAAQVPAEDRWAIAAYIRALQLSQNAPVADVPTGGAAEARGPEAMNASDLRLPPLDRVRTRALGVGLAALLVCGLWGTLNPAQFFRSYLFAYVLWLGLPLGCLAILMLQHLVQAAWGFVIQRPLEAGSRTLPFMALLFLPLLLGIHSLYAWAQPAALAADAVLRAKQPYLNAGFFVLRAAVYFTLWIACAHYLVKWSLERDRTGDASMLRRLKVISGPGLVLYGLTVTFAAIDWVMSLEPHWYSTIYGMMYMVGFAITGLAGMIVAAYLLARRGPMSDVLTPNQFHDLGNLLLAFVMLWTYLNFSQFLIVWAENLTEEIPWYLHRIAGGWSVLVLLLFGFMFVLPFLLLLSRTTKTHAALLAMVAGGILVMRTVDVFWLVVPAFSPTGFTLHGMDLLSLAGLGGIWLWAFLTHLGRHPLLPLNDPRVERVGMHAHGAES